MKRNEGIIYVHIPKCGGTSLHRVIQQQLLKGDYVQTPKALKETRKYRGVGGHFRLGRHPENVLRSDIVYYNITILRDPVERVLSFYRYVKSERHPHYLRDLARKHGFDMARFSLSDFMSFCIDHGNTEVSNLQVKYLCGGDVAISSMVARENLDSRVEVWGVVEKMGEFYQRLGDRFGVSLVEVRENQTQKARASRSEVAIIEKYNELDCALWASLFDS